MKKVSLILTTYNCKENLLNTFKSIEVQDYPNIEVCISDSCSTDGTLKVIEEYAKSSKHSVVYKSEKDTCDEDFYADKDKNNSAEDCGFA